MYHKAHDNTVHIMTFVLPDILSNYQYVHFNSSDSSGYMWLMTKEGKLQGILKIIRKTKCR